MGHGGFGRIVDRLGVVALNENEILIIDEVTPEDAVVGEVVELPDRPFLTTPLNDYTVTEGLLLISAMLLVFGFIRDALKGGFWWLW